MFLFTVGNFCPYGWFLQNADSVLTFVSHIVYKFYEYDILENFGFLSTTMAIP